MELIELKFLLKLVSKSDYRASITELKPNEKTSASQRDKICRDLRERELVACSEEVTKIKITPAGNALLQLDVTDLPVTPNELKILKACNKGTIPPSKTNVKPASTRNEAMDNLSQKGLIEAAQTKLKEVWLTERGKDYLAKEYEASGGGNIILSKKMLTDYLRFMRKYLLNSQVVATADTTPQVSIHKPSDEEILQAIAETERELGSNNYLPIFHLRQKLQPPLSRDELDNALYRLQRQDKIEFSSLVEAVKYTKEQIDAGIPQDVGGPLFFLIVN